MVLHEPTTSVPDNAAESPESHVTGSREVGRAGSATNNESLRRSPRKREDNREDVAGRFQLPPALAQKKGGAPKGISAHPVRGGTSTGCSKVSG